MSFGRISENGPYPIWVARLSMWSKDPSTSLVGLPHLDETTFDQDTYMRLMQHLNEAVRVFMDQWNRELGNAFQRASSDHEIANELIRLRHLLEPRLRLARHESWPDTIRRALMSGLEEDLRSIQGQIEQALMTTTDRGRSNVGRGQQLVEVARQNSLLGLLKPPTQITEVSYAPPPPTHVRQEQPPRPTRRILF